MATPLNDIEIPRVKGGPLRGCMASPETPGPHAGVVIIHEAYGLNENIRDITRRFAEAGYVGLAVDLFSGGGVRAICIMQVMGGMMLRPLNNGTVRKLQDTVDWLKTRAEVDSERMGVIGFCMGGAYALSLACLNEDVHAASVFYGRNPRPLSAVARACPVVGSYPGRDFTTRGQARKLEQALQQYETPHDIRVYPDAKHSFFNDRGRAYNEEASADAWQRTLAFFETHLRGESR